MKRHRQTTFKSAFFWSIMSIGITFVSLMGASTAFADTSFEPNAKLSLHEAQINELLDGFHHAAAIADGADYFSRFTNDAVFLGTDASERWTVAEFKAYAKPIFAKGRGWAYHKLERHITLDATGEVGWFDEILNNDTLGRCRGTGVVTRDKTGWKINHYSLTLLVPNSIADEIGALTKLAEHEAGDH
jgi:hypothetical protein